MLKHVRDYGFNSVNTLEEGSDFLVQLNENSNIARYMQTSSKTILQKKQGRRARNLN